MESISRNLEFITNWRVNPPTAGKLNEVSETDEETREDESGETLSKLLLLNLKEETFSRGRY